MEDLGSDYEEVLVFHMTKFYGNLLKVSRSRFCTQTLPRLRAYVAANPQVVEDYISSIEDECVGQGLDKDAVLKSLITAQKERLLNGESKDSTSYSDEIEKLIKEGKTDRVAGTEAVADVHAEMSELQRLAYDIINNPLEVDCTTIPKKACDMARMELMRSYRVFSNWAFELQMQMKFQEQDFHTIIYDVGQKIVDGVLDRVIITIPPRHSKTQTMSISLPLYSFCHNAGSHSIITSYADDIVQESSGYIRTVMLDPLFQKVFPNVRIDPNKRSLERWGTTKQGVLHAVPTGGKLTGKGAGSLSEKYSGLFVVDDAIKPKDAYSDAVRNEVNDRFNNTFMSRLANDGIITVNGQHIKCPRTPMVIIMQRVHDLDLVGYLLRGGSTDKYHYLNIPAIVEDTTGSQDWYEKLIRKQAYTHAIPITYDLKRETYPSALWPARKSLESLVEMKKRDPYTYNSQYAGDPSAQGHGLVQESWWNEYDPNSFDWSSISHSFITADTASTKQDYSDFSVLIHWCVQKTTRNLYARRIMVGKHEVPELKIAVTDFWNECTSINGLTNFALLPTALHMEDKSSGQFLNQQFLRDGNIRCLPVPRDKSGGDKLARFLNTLPYFSQARIWWPTGDANLDHCKREVLGITEKGSGTGHDDVCDNVSDACAIEFSGLSANYGAWI